MERGGKKGKISGFFKPVTPGPAQLHAKLVAARQARAPGSQSARILPTREYSFAGPALKRQRVTAIPAADESSLAKQQSRSCGGTCRRDEPTKDLRQGTAEASTRGGGSGHDTGAGNAVSESSRSGKGVAAVERARGVVLPVGAVSLDMITRRTEGELRAAMEARAVITVRRILEITADGDGGNKARGCRTGEKRSADEGAGAGGNGPDMWWIRTPETAARTPAARILAARTPAAEKAAEPAPAPRAPSTARSLVKAAGPCASRAGKQTQQQGTEAPAPPARRPGKLGQAVLNFGQRTLAPVTCPDCGMLYRRGDAGDEKAHAKFHAKRARGAPLAWPARGSGRDMEVASLPPAILGALPPGARVVAVTDDEPRRVRDRLAREIWERVDEDLGAPPGLLESRAATKAMRTYLCVVGKRVAGCVVAEPIRAAYRVLAVNQDAREKEVSPSSVECSMTRVPAMCGISRIWVDREYRGAGLATALLDVMRLDVSYGAVVPRAMCAFSSPSEDGRRLAEHYFGTPAFLVYRDDGLPMDSRAPPHPAKAAQDAGSGFMGSVIGIADEADDDGQL